MHFPDISARGTRPRASSAGSDFLRDGIYELRIGLQGMNYRMLYFFHDNVAAVVSHGLVKEAAVPPKEIDLALARKKLFLSNPAKHSYEETV